MLLLNRFYYATRNDLAKRNPTRTAAARELDLLNEEVRMDAIVEATSPAIPWSKGRLIGQTLPLKLKEIWAIRIRLQLADRLRDLELFNLAIDCKLRGCDLVSLKVKDVAQGRTIFHRAVAMQRKTSRPIQFKITEQTRQSVISWIERCELTSSQYLFPAEYWLPPSQRHGMTSSRPSCRAARAALARLRVSSAEQDRLVTDAEQQDATELGCRDERRITQFINA